MYDERLLKDNEAEKPEQLPPVGSMPLLDIAILLPEYFSLRKKAKALKQKRADMHGKGSIENQRGCELHDDEWGECFESKLPEAEWCDYCRERQVVHREYHNTVRQAQSIWMKIYRRYGMSH